MKFWKARRLVCKVRRHHKWKAVGKSKTLRICRTCRAIGRVRRK